MLSTDERAVGAPTAALQALLHVELDERGDVLDVREVVRMEIDVILGRREDDMAEAAVEPLLHFTFDFCRDFSRGVVWLDRHGSSRFARFAAGAR